MALALVYHLKSTLLLFFEPCTRVGNDNISNLLTEILSGPEIAILTLAVPLSISGILTVL